MPLAVSAFTALRIQRQGLLDQRAELELRTAHHAAALTQGWLDATRRGLTAVTARIPWRRLSPDEVRGALSMVYGQLDSVAVVAVLDERGRGVAQSVFLAPHDERMPEHPHVSVAALSELVERMPSTPGAGEPAHFGEAFVAPDSRAAGGELGPVTLVPLAIHVPGEGPGWTLVAALSIAKLCRELASAGGEDARVAVIDPRGRQLCPPAPGEPLAAVPPAIGEKLATGEPRIHYRDPGGEAIVAAWAETAAGWTVLASQPEASALAPVRAIERQTWFWLALGVVVALIAGVYLARGITRPVRELTAGARRLAAGDRADALPVRGEDELAELARAFNAMSEEVARREDEIRGWNRDLERRVDERTRERNEAQEQLLQSRKIAALSSLAAGVAHEINNPLTAVLGLAQYLARRGHQRGADPRELSALGDIEGGARRIHDIVQVLQSLSTEVSGITFAAVDARALVGDAVERVRAECERKGVELAVSVDHEVPAVHGNESQLREVLGQLLRNAIAATESGERISVTVGALGADAASSQPTPPRSSGVVRIAVADTGRGIAPEHLERIFEPFFTTKDEWQGRGLGLTVSHRIVETHHGTLRVDSTPGEGTTAVVILPASSGGAHLV